MVFSILGTPNYLVSLVCKNLEKKPQNLFPGGQLRYHNKAILRLYTMNIMHAHHFILLSYSNFLPFPFPFPSFFLSLFLSFFFLSFPPSLSLSSFLVAFPSPRVEYARTRAEEKCSFNEDACPADDLPERVPCVWKTSFQASPSSAR